MFRFFLQASGRGAPSPPPYKIFWGELFSEGVAGVFIKDNFLEVEARGGLGVFEEY